MSDQDPFGARRSLGEGAEAKTYYALEALASHGPIEKMPRSIRVLLEAVLRNVDGLAITEEDVKALAAYDARNIGPREIPYSPARVVLQDFTGVPAVVDLAAMREGMRRMGGRPEAVNPLVPCDLVIDHSVQVDAFNSAQALTINSEKEFERNRERYEFLKWGQGSFDNFSVVPPATGIVHQVNLEYLARGVMEKDGVLFPDSLVGTDSHTTMINGLGVLGWGVGGIEAEAVMCGQPIYMLMPEVIGFRFDGRLPEGATATDLVLTVTEILREHGVVGKFVEFYGPGLAEMPLANRATIANMAPEYGATCGFFPVDDRTLEYLELTGRDPAHIETIERYCRAQGLWRDDANPPVFTEELALDLATIEPSLAGPKRPQDRISLSAMKSQWEQDLCSTFGRGVSTCDSTPASMQAEGGGAAVAAEPQAERGAGLEGVEVEYDGQHFKLRHGSVVIAAITSCTNTSNPEVMLGAGLVARKALERGLSRKPWVKTSLAPGSKVVTDYLEKAELLDDLEALGFYLVGYGCTTCIGNSGPLPEPIREVIQAHELVAASVLSGNRNFEGRISPHVQANYLASPPLVVAYALAGTVDIDLVHEPIGRDAEGRDVYLKDLWPSQLEIQQAVEQAVSRQQFLDKYANVFEGSQAWQAIGASEGSLYEWDPDSTYVQEPPFFTEMQPEPAPIRPVEGARVLVKVGDSVTTDHISPAGAIPADGPAGKYLQRRGVPVSGFNSFGSRRGNHEVMMRGTFANVRVRNQLAPGTEGGWTTYFGPAAEADPDSTFAPDEPVAPGEVTSIYDAAGGYHRHGIPLIVLAGQDYGMGSSRDWAAKGTHLLGVKAVIAESYERIHRSNLIGMGVLPMEFMDGQGAAALGLDGTETFDMPLDDGLEPRQTIPVKATGKGGRVIEFEARARLDTEVEVEYYRHGGILHMVLRRMTA